MTADQVIELIGLIHDEFDRLGWRDTGNTAQALARALISGQSPGRAASRASNQFLVRNDITTDVLERVLQGITREALPPPAPPPPTLVSDLVASEQIVRKSRSVPQGRRAVTQAPSPPPSITGETAARAMLGLIIVTASGLTVFVVPDATHWTWLLNHTNRLGIEWGAFAVALFLAGGVVFRRWEFSWPAVVAAIVMVISLLGH